MGLATLFQWFPVNGNYSLNNNDPLNSNYQLKGHKDEDRALPAKVEPQHWATLAEAKKNRLPLILYFNGTSSGSGYQSLVLMLDQKSCTCYIDVPFPALPSDLLAFPIVAYAMIKEPGTYQHWYLEGSILERAQAEDGPYFKFRIDKMGYCEDRRRRVRFNVSDKGAEVSCTPPLEQPIYGNLENISQGGICFHARGNLQQSDAFFLAHQGRKTAIPASIQLNSDDKLQVQLEVLAMHVLKKPYLHTRIRARFKDLTPSQQHVLAALAEKLDISSA